MAIGIDDLDDDDVIYQNPEENNPSQPSIEGEGNQDDDSFISNFLKTRGIEDISHIKFEDDNGQIEEKDWNSLSKDEKFNILNTPLEVPSNNGNENDLTDEEINLLNTIRESNLTPSEYLSQFQTPVNNEPRYKVDDLSDDEIYLLDLESRVGELPDETAAQALASAKQNEELFNKQIEGIRKEYKEREDLLQQQEQADLEQQQQEAYNQFQDSIIDSISQLNSIGDLEFDDGDKEELAEFILSRDEAGNNYLWQALQDPQTLVKAAWFILNGDEAINNLSDYFINQIKLVSDNQYKKGFEDAKKGNEPSRPTIVIDKTKNNKNTVRQLTRSDDLDDDE